MDFEEQHKLRRNRTAHYPLLSLRNSQLCDVARFERVLQLLPHLLCLDLSHTPYLDASVIELLIQRYVVVVFCFYFPLR
jgi:hypothetical protein